jgi:hypothetical protein
VANALTGDPVPPVTGKGATVSMNSHRFNFAAVAARASKVLIVEQVDVLPSRVHQIGRAELIVLSPSTPIGHSLEQLIEFGDPAKLAT